MTTICWDGPAATPEEYADLLEQARELGCTTVEANYLPAEHLKRRIDEALNA